ncbi:MAG TPA: amino acid permease [Thermoanaerobaculia bacterium]|nr:amino acid permease [Thermoanaerobaculia bacterium]
MGIGIFLTPAQLIGTAASPASIIGLWLIAGALVVAGAWTFGELAARHPQEGGTYVYLEKAWGRPVAFLYGWQSLLVMDPGITAALTLGLSEYLVILAPGAAGYEKWLAVGAIWLLALLNMAGLKLSSRVLNLLTVAKILAFLAVVLASFTMASGSWDHFVPFAGRRPGSPPWAATLALALTGIFYSYGGFWEASRVAGEVRDPRRDLPRALAAGVLAVTAIYLAMTVAFLYLVPAREASSASGFARHAGQALWGSSGPTVLAAIVILSAVPSVMAFLLMAPRAYLAMARDGLFPGALARRGAHLRSPVRATVLLAAIATIYVLSGSFGEILTVFLCTAFVFVALAASGLFLLRRREPESSAFRVPGFPITTALFVILVLGAVGIIAAGRPLQASIGAALVLAGLPVYVLLVRREATRARSAEEKVR